MQILIDLERMKYLYTGLGQFTYNLGRSLAEVESDFDFKFLLPAQHLDLFKGEKIEKVGLRRKFMPWLCDGFDLWHATHQDSDYNPRSYHEPYLLTIHDLNFLGEKSGAKAEARLKRLQKKVDRARAITVISDFTRKQIEENLRLDSIPIFTIPNGVQQGALGESKKPGSAGVGKPFLFALGVVRAKKNFHVLLDFLEGIEGYNLVIAGDDSGDYGDKIKRMIKEKGLEDRVFLLGSVAEAERAWLYQHCEAFVFPSLFEGFGMPVIEAMSFGKPVFCSDQTSLPEVGGSEAYYWKSFEPREMQQVFHAGMEEFAKDSSKPEQLKKHAGRYTWKNAAEGYLKVYQKILY